MSTFTAWVNRRNSDGAGDSSSENGNKTDAGENPNNGEKSTVHGPWNFVTVTETIRSKLHYRNDNYVMIVLVFCYLVDEKFR